MATAGPSKVPHNYSPDKFVSSAASNISFDESDGSILMHDNNMNRDPYINTPSPSSSTSVSTTDRSLKWCSSKLKNGFRLPKRRYRYDKLFHLTHSLNRQYVIAMTNVLFQMQKEIYKLKKRTYYVEHALAKQKASGRPIIRIRRLTKDEISTICVNDNGNQQNVTSKISEENENNIESQRTIIKNIKPLNEYKIDTESSITIENKLENNGTKIHRRKQLNPKNKYCSRCQHEFAHRSAYLRHMRRVHQGKFTMISNNNHTPGIGNSQIETNTLISDHSNMCSEIDNAMEQDPLPMLVNQWDIGEGRLRPRPASKLHLEPLSKIKCNICNKFYRSEYIKKHQRRTHHVTEKSSSDELNNNLSSNKSINHENIYEIQPIASESSANTTNPPSTLTITELDTDEMPILFRRDANKPIIFSVTCLERDQLDIVNDFLRKFSPRASQTTTINSQTTHLITNDDKHALHSPLSMKLIEAIANHCYCVSYRWLLDCVKYDRIIDEGRYEIEGDDTDYHPQGGPKRSRTIDKHHSLFENICFMIKCTENNEIQMTNERLQSLITICGGRIITCVTQNLLDQFEIVVLCDKLYVSERRHNYDQCHSLGIHFVSSDWVLESILEYRLKLYSLYEETPL
ncbi:unnamed protein product [Rotaria sordida]|uniref:Uncharacterized protein n=1 Tax=Rotaria sordida TaxID=392033 RepID=A0A819I5V0_9BILA|nr:unnamed protein product [Rotaria sordida]